MLIARVEVPLQSCNTPRRSNLISAADLYSQKGPVLIYLGDNGSRGWGVSTDRTGERKNKLAELAKLKRAALAELERRGYEVHGKTPAQIRETLKRRPKKSRAN